MILPLISIIEAKSQEVYVGDSLAMMALKEKAAETYNGFDSTFFLLTKENFEIIESHGSSLIVNLIKGRIARIVSLNHSANGILGSEWYFDEQGLFYAYFSFEKFEEIESQSKWRNFKGIKGWESRFYFLNEQIIGSRHKGISTNEDYDFKSLQKMSEGLMTFVQRFL